MATLAQLEAAFIKADDAGNTEDAQAFATEIKRLRAEAQPKEPPPQAPNTSLLQDVAQGVGNVAAGAVRGAGSIGATILAPIDKLTDIVVGDRKATAGKKPLSRNDERRQQIDEGLRLLGADTDSFAYGAGKLGAEIAGTAGVGGGIANALASSPKIAAAAPRLIEAVRTGGFNASGATGARGLATRAAGGAVTGGASAGLVDPDQTGTGVIIGGGLPVVAKGLGAAGNALGRSIAGKAPAPEVQALATRAKELGIDIPADRLVDSKPLNALASSLNYVPLSGRAATERAMHSQMNTALSRTFGQDSPNVTQALRKADGVLGGEFDRVLSANTVKVDNQWLQELADHASRATKELGSDGERVIVNQIDEILNKAVNGQIDGQAAYNIKKTLDRIGQRNTPEAYYALDLKKTLMGALDRSLGPDEAAAFANIRKQYGNMLSLEKLAKNGPEGDISIGRLANMKNIRSPDLQELADIAAQFLVAREGNHGAAQRIVMGIAGAALGGSTGLAAGMGAGRAANSLLNSNMAKAAVMGQPMASLPLGNALRGLRPAGYQAGQLNDR